MSNTEQFRCDEVPAKDVEENGFAHFNQGPHLCVDVPDGWSTITCKTSEGHKVTFAFIPYREGGPASCIDIMHHTGEKFERHGETRDRQEVICFSGGGPDPFHSKRDAKGNPVTLVTLLINHPED